MQQINAGDKCRSVRAKDLSDDTIISEVAVVPVNCQCKYQTSHQCHHRHLPAIPVGDYEVPQETGSKVLIAGIAQYRRWLLYDFPLSTVWDKDNSSSHLVTVDQSAEGH